MCDTWSQQQREFTYYIQELVPGIGDTAENKTDSSCPDRA